MTKQNPLIGRVVTAIHLADDNKAIKFDIEGGNSIVAKCDGDCCSSTWIENVENAQAVIGVPVHAAEDIAMPDLSGEKKEDDYGDVIAYYGFKIETPKGTCVIDYRNESNGYYGGNLAWPGEYFYGGVHGQNESKEAWKQIAPAEREKGGA